MTLIEKSPLAQTENSMEPFLRFGFYNIAGPVQQTIKSRQGGPLPLFSKEGNYASLYHAKAWEIRGDFYFMSLLL